MVKSISRCYSRRFKKRGRWVKEYGNWVQRFRRGRRVGRKWWVKVDLYEHRRYGF